MSTEDTADQTENSALPADQQDTAESEVKEPAAPDTPPADKAEEPDIQTAADPALTEAPPVPETVFVGYSQVAEPTPVVVVAAPSMSKPPFPHDAYALPLSFSGSSRLVIQELKDYVELMNQKVRLHTAAGGQAQAGLYHTLIQLINTPSEEFEVVFTLAMTIIKDQLEGAFSDVNIHRYTPHITLPAKPAAHLRYLINALITLADPATREVGKRQTNVEQALGSNQIKEESRQRVLAFFNF